jgi:tetratricopeptide (TPR) repeat protein
VLLDQRLNNWTAATSQPPTYEAYAEFLLGMRTFGADYENSVHHFLRAAQLDSSYRQALLWAAMAKANMRRYREADSLFRTIDGVRGTLAPYDEANFDYFYGGFVRGDWERAYDGARRMVDLAPGAGHALYAAGLTAQITNRPQEAIDHLTRIDTRDGWGKSWSARVHNLLARASHQLGDYAAELERAMRLRDAEPNVGWTRLAEVKALAALGRGGEAVRRAVEGAAFPPTTSTWEDYSPGDFLWQSGRELAAHGYASETRALFERAERWFATRAGADRETVENRRGHARVLYALGRWEEARSLYASVLADDPGTAEHRGAMGVIAARLGRGREADSIAALLAVDDRPYQFGAPSLWAGRIAAVRGDREAAIAMLHQALREGHSRRYTWHADPDFASLRDFPAFRELLQPRVPNGR